MSPDELVPLGAAAASVAVAVVTFIGAPWIKAWIERRAHEQGGWTKAVEALEARVTDLSEEVDGLRVEVGGLRRQLSERDQRIAALESTIAAQTQSLARANGRVRQLELAWPPGLTMPAPDPATHEGRSFQ